jgi:hypothetical protein
LGSQAQVGDVLGTVASLSGLDVDAGQDVAGLAFEVVELGVEGQGVEALAGLHRAAALASRLEVELGVAVEGEGHHGLASGFVLAALAGQGVEVGGRRRCGASPSSPCSC